MNTYLQNIISRTSLVAMPLIYTSCGTLNKTAFRVHEKISPSPIPIVHVQGEPEKTYFNKQFFSDVGQKTTNYLAKRLVGKADSDRGNNGTVGNRLAPSRIERQIENQQFGRSNEVEEYYKDIDDGYDSRNTSSNLFGGSDGTVYLSNQGKLGYKKKMWGGDIQVKPSGRLTHGKVDVGANIVFRTEW